MKHRRGRTRQHENVARLKRLLARRSRHRAATVYDREHGGASLRPEVQLCESGPDTGSTGWDQHPGDVTKCLEKGFRFRRRRRVAGLPA